MFNFFGPFAHDPVEQLIQLYRITHRGGGPVWTTVSGVAPLTLPNAVDRPILSLTQTGKCEQNGTPTPNAPVDIVCNNGVLTKPHDTYTAVDGQGTYASPGAAANRIYKAFNVGDGNYTISVPTAYDFIVQYKTPTDGSTPTDSGNITSWVNGYTTVTLDKGTAYGYGIALRDHVNQSGNISPSDFSGTIVVVHDDEPVKAVATPETLTVSNGGVLELNATRYYAYISTSNTWSYSADSYSIVVPVEVGRSYTITADPTTPIDGSVVNIILRWGFVDTVYDDWKQTAVVPPSASVTIYDWVRSTPQETQSVEVTATHPYMILQMGAAAFESNIANGRIGVSLVATETQTVNDIPMLLSVGDYKDAAEIIDGINTGAVGVLVIDGTEGWTKVSGYNAFYVVPDDMKSCNPTEPGLCTHFKGDGSATASMADNTVKLSYTSVGQGAIMIKCNAYTTADEFKAGAAAAYASGNPWIALYPRATEQTEQGTPHSLSTAQGTNTVTAVTNVGAVTLSVEYAAAAAGG